MARSLKERFWEKVDKTGNCWIWTAACMTNGYGQIWDGSKDRGAHRISWILHNGPIPNNLHVLHKCDNPPCVRPDHLFLGTPIDNMLDAKAKGRLNSTKSHCKNGHAYTKKNTGFASIGYRVCLACLRIRERAYLKAARITA